MKNEQKRKDRHTCAKKSGSTFQKKTPQSYCSATSKIYVRAILVDQIQMED